ncbi:methyltransferase [Streptomyces niveiscabiei]|uniref:methyltransferase n=1 Tax=Streptomyces niveiscabiei TaxID=164115 RepID=UPI0029A328E1|nr:methyltransferase [Streptomyces niveiscabiei]MDX3386237.1 methyltransferase [Streptomyces niveiscabiei]
MTPEEEKALVLRTGVGTWLPHMLYALIGLGIPDRLTDEPRPVADVAADTGTLPDPLARTLRTAVSLGFFTEGPPEHFALNDAGRLLRSDSPGTLRAGLHITITRLLPLFAEFAHTLRTGEPAAEKLYGMPYYEHLAADPVAGQEFDRHLARTTPVVAEALLGGDTLDGAGTLVDVGGGNGTLLELLLRARPKLRGVLLDRPDVVAGAAGRLRDAGLADRCELAGGDFFASVPAGGDVYVIARCLHNWDDDRATRILRSVRDAAGPGSRLLVVEEVVPEETDPAEVAHSDVLMLLLGGRERTAGAYRRLLAGAGFETGAVRPAGRLRVFEARPR